MQQRNGQTAPTIDVHNRDELRWWAKELHVSEDQLRGAIANVGNSSDAVRQVLERSRQGSERSSGATNVASGRAYERDEHQLLPDRGLIDAELAPPPRGAVASAADSVRRRPIERTLQGVLIMCLAAAFAIIWRSRSR